MYRTPSGVVAEFTVYPGKNKIIQNVTLSDEIQNF